MSEVCKLEFKPRNTNRARELRNAATPFERALWRHLSASKLDGHKFSRQMPIGPYFVDFLCRSKKLVIEIDGYSHDLRQGYDAARTHYLESEGYRVLRFSNCDIRNSLEGVLVEIAQALEARPTPSPSRKREGDL